MIATSWENIIAPSILKHILCLGIGLVFWFFMPEGSFCLTEEIGLDPFSQLLRFLPLADDVSRWCIFVVIFLLCESLLLINYQYLIIRIRTLLPTFMALLLFMFMMDREAYSRGTLLSILLLLIICSALSFTETGSQKHTFNIGLLIAFGSCFYPFFCVFLLPIIFLFYYCNYQYLRTWLAIISGAIVVAIYAFLLQYGLEAFYQMQIQLFYGEVEWQEMEMLVSLEWYEQIYYLYFVLLTIYSIIRLSSFFMSESIRQRGIFMFLVIVFALVVVLAAFTHRGFCAMIHNVILLSSFFVGGQISALYGKDIITTWTARLFFISTIAFVGLKVWYML